MSASVRIVKMSGAGNDFVVVRGDDADRIGDAFVAWVRGVCRRGLSIGADGVLAVEPVGPERVRARFWNPDGSVAFCGNGTRCAARFAHREGWVGAKFTLDTAVGAVPAEVADDRVRLTLPAPVDHGEIELDVGGTRVRGRRVTAGVPHYVVAVDDVARAPLDAWGPILRRHAAFGDAGTNVDLVSRAPDGIHDVRTWERGVEGETLACGTGAVAVAAALRAGGADAIVSIRPRSRSVLEVRFPAGAPRPATVELVGDARVVLEGRVEPEALAG